MELPTRSPPSLPKRKSSRQKKSFKPALPKIRIEKRFTLLNRMGQGSMSKVWRAIDNVSGKNVCLKVLDKVKTNALKQRFVGLQRPDEGEVAVKLIHPNIVRTSEHGLTHLGEEYLVMELIEGVSLNFLIDTRDKRFVGNELEYLIQAGEAIAYFHEQGYIHRDICPRNIMVTNENVVKLIDFGLAVPNTPQFRKPGNRTGTAAYMAPELIKRSHTDQRIDVFSFGVTVYEAFANTHPWENIPESLQAMLNHINAPARDLREIKPGMDEELIQIIEKGIAKNPNERYQTMNAFVEALRNYKEKLEAKSANS